MGPKIILKKWVKKWSLKFIVKSEMNKFVYKVGSWRQIQLAAQICRMT